MEVFCTRDISTLRAWGYWNILGSWNQATKIITIHKRFKLYQVFIYNILYQTVLIFPIYILFTERIDIIWSTDISSIWVLVHFEFEIHIDFWTISNFHVRSCANIFQCILSTKRIDTTWSVGIDTFWPGVLADFSFKKSGKKIQKELWIISSLCV